MLKVPTRERKQEMRINPAHVQEAKQDWKLRKEVHFYPLHACISKIVVEPTADPKIIEEMGRHEINAKTIVKGYE